MPQETIVALSSGALPSGVAVIRISGPDCNLIGKTFLKDLPNKREAQLKSIIHPVTNEILDKGLVFWFPRPNSFTGDDCLEFQVHGGRAVVEAILQALCTINNVRLAEPGEFSRRAFENGKLDLTEIEGIADLVASETETQRKQALIQSGGKLRMLYEGWRTHLIHMRAMIEAELDFSEEEDVPEEISVEGFSQVKLLKDEIDIHLNDNRSGEIIRDGYKIVLMGKPNAGKSSLLNALAKRDVAIVTNEAGTTRDVLDVQLNVNGYSVIVSDTAGVRETDNIVEIEGVSRALLKGDEADLVIWLTEINDNENFPSFSHDYNNILHIISKDDSRETIGQISISTITDCGLESLLNKVKQILDTDVKFSESGLISRLRYREALLDASNLLTAVIENDNLEVELKAENLRLASDCIGRITGRIDVEDLLDVIFSEFCVGK